MNDGSGQNMSTGNLMGGNSLRTLEHRHLDKQQGYAEARRHLQAENSDVTRTVQEKAATVPKKRGRKPKSQQKPEEVCHDSMTNEKEKLLKNLAIGRIIIRK